LRKKGDLKIHLLKRAAKKASFHKGNRITHFSKKKGRRKDLKKKT